MTTNVRELVQGFVRGLGLEPSKVAEVRITGDEVTALVLVNGGKLLPREDGPGRDFVMAYRTFPMSTENNES